MMKHPTTRGGSTIWLVSSPPLTLFGPLPELLLRLRRAADFSQAKAAEKSGVSERSISDYENAKAVPGVDAFESLLLAYGVRNLLQLQREVDAVTNTKSDFLGPVYTEADSPETLEDKMADRFKLLAHLLGDRQIRRVLLRLLGDEPEKP